MREKTMRCGLLAINVALVGMYFFPRETAKAGWLPPATQEELQTAHARREHTLAALGETTASLQAQNSQPIAPGESDSAAGTTHSFTPCEAPVSEHSAFDFGLGL